MSDWSKQRVRRNDGHVEFDPSVAVISQSLAEIDWSYGRPRHDQRWVMLVEQDDLVIMLNRREDSSEVVAIIYRKVMR